MAGLPTPMGYGIVAFADHEKAAERAAERSGTVYSWSDVFDLAIEPGKIDDHAHAGGGQMGEMNAHDMDEMGSVARP